MKYYFFPFAVFYCATIISGGIKLNEETRELNLTKVSQTIGISKTRLPNFPEYSDSERTLVTMSNGNILSCGGQSKLCFVLKKRAWVKHSTMNSVRIGAVGVQMPNGIYMFGGNKSPNTSEFLPNGSTVWHQGPEIPYFFSSLLSFGSNFLNRLSMLPFECDYKAKGHAI